MALNQPRGTTGVLLRKTPFFALNISQKKNTLTRQKQFVFLAYCRLVDTPKSPLWANRAQTDRQPAAKSTAVMVAAARFRIIPPQVTARPAAAAAAGCCSREMHFQWAIFCDREYRPARSITASGKEPFLLLVALGATTSKMYRSERARPSSSSHGRAAAERVSTIFFCSLSY